jgi:LPS export ABC transporter protein LptC
MRKIPLAILCVVVVFLSIVVGVLVTKSRGTRVAPSEATQTTADYRIKEVHLQEEDKAGGRWQLDAEYGEIFEGQGKTVMKKVVIHVNQPTRLWTVSSDEGELARDTRDVELRGHVVVVTSDGLRLETELLNWTAAEQRAWTNEPVTIYRDGVVVQGQGFESKVNEETTRIKGRLRATITGTMAGFGRGRS